MKRILLAALAATALSATALAQSASGTATDPSNTVGTPMPSTGQVGSGSLDTSTNSLSPVRPNTTDMDQPAGTSLSGSMNGSTGLDSSTWSPPSSISPGRLTPPSVGAGLPDVGSPQPSLGDTSGVNNSLSPSTTPGVSR